MQYNIMRRVDFKNIMWIRCNKNQYVAVRRTSERRGVAFFECVVSCTIMYRTQHWVCFSFLLCFETRMVAAKVEEHDSKWKQKLCCSSDSMPGVSLINSICLFVRHMKFRHGNIAWDYGFVGFHGALFSSLFTRRLGSVRLSFYVCTIRYTNSRNIPR